MTINHSIINKPKQSIKVLVVLMALHSRKPAVSFSEPKFERLSKPDDSKICLTSRNVDGSRKLLG